MQELKKPAKIAIAVIGIISISLLYLIVPKFIPEFTYKNSILNAILNVLVSVGWKIIVSVICFLIVKLILKRKIGITKKNFFYGFFIIGWILIIYTLCNFFGSFPYSLQGEGVDYSLAPIKLILYLVSCLGIGLVEESIWRVLAINLFLWAFGEDKKSKTLAVTFSAIIFGLAHINNILSIPTIPNKTFSQVLYASIMGFYFGVSYIKSENILPSILHHALFDYACYSTYCFYPEGQLIEVITGDISIISAVVNVITHIPLLIYSILLLFDILKFINEDIKKYRLNKKTL